jgi:hypothetical protein
LVNVAVILNTPEGANGTLVGSRVVLATDSVTISFTSGVGTTATSRV